TGRADGTDLSIGQRKIGDLNFDLHGSVHSEAGIGPQIRLQSERISLFGGEGRIDGRGPGKDALLRVSVGIHGISLSQALARTDVGGTMAGNWIVTLLSPSLDGVRIVPDGSQPPITIDDLKYGDLSRGAAGEYFAASHVVVEKMKVEDGRVT